MKLSKIASSSVFVAATCTSALQPVSTASALNKTLEMILRSILGRFCNNEKIDKIINYIDKLFSSNEDDGDLGSEKKVVPDPAKTEKESDSNADVSLSLNSEENRQLIGDYYFKDGQYAICPFINRILIKERKADISYSQELVLGTMYLQVYDKVSGYCALFPAVEENVVYIVNSDSNGKRSYDKYNFNLMQKITYDDRGYSVQNSWCSFTVEEFKNIPFINEANRCLELIKIYDRGFYERFKSMAAFPSFYSGNDIIGFRVESMEQINNDNKSMAQLARELQQQGLFFEQQMRQNNAQTSNVNNN